MFPERQQRLYRILRTQGLDALALVPGYNLRYLTGLSFHLMERPILALLMPDQPIRVVLPALERAKVEASGLAAELCDYGEAEGAATAAFAKAAQEAALAGARIGVEPTNMRHLEYTLLMQAAPDAQIVPAGAGLEELRIIKVQAEIEAMQSAAAIAERALEETLPHVRAGMTELELASELTLQLLRAGSEPEIPFSPIVASGPNSALPHATPTQRKLQAGELLLLDWGATYSGYVSDITRTFALGEMEAEFSAVHRIVEQANAAGRSAAMPGATCESVDRAARELIEAAGYGERFVHRTGHGLGMQGHEAPYIREGETAALRPGMTFTVEPGIYLPGRGGVRVEDDVVVTEEDSFSLTHLPRELRRIGI